MRSVYPERDAVERGGVDLKDARKKGETEEKGGWLFLSTFREWWNDGTGKPTTSQKAKEVISSQLMIEEELRGTFSALGINGDSNYPTRGKILTTTEITAIKHTHQRRYITRRFVWGALLNQYLNKKEKERNGGGRVRPLPAPQSGRGRCFI